MDASSKKRRSCKEEPGGQVDLQSVLHRAFKLCSLNNPEAVAVAVPARHAEA